MSENTPAPGDDLRLQIAAHAKDMSELRESAGATRERMNALEGRMDRFAHQMGAQIGALSASQQHGFDELRKGDKEIAEQMQALGKIVERREGRNDQKDTSRPLMISVLAVGVSSLGLLLALWVNLQ